MNQKEQEEATIELLTDIADATDTPGYLSAEELAVNLPDHFPTLESAEDTMERLEAQGMLDRSEFDGDFLFKPTRRAFRQAEAEAGEA